MDEIKWLEVAINTTPERLDEITAKLTAAGMTGLVIEDEAEFQQFLEQNRQYWDYVDQELMERMRGVTRVKFYVTDDADGRAQLERYTRGLECEYTTRTLVDNDWAYSWQKYYKPLSIGERLYVVPQWEREEPVPQGRVPFYLNPGLTFGTGSHASTQLCLEGVEAHTRQGDRVLDLGCGSGILSIAALVLGAERASAVDIDPKAVAIARANAEKADVEDVVRFEVADAAAFRRDAPYGRVVTNPPYGERILEKREAEELYRAFGRAVRTLPEGWRVSVLSSHTEFERTFGRAADKKRKLYNGMLKCDLFQYGR